MAIINWFIGCFNHWQVVSRWEIDKISISTILEAILSSLLDCVICQTSFWLIAKYSMVVRKRNKFLHYCPFLPWNWDIEVSIILLSFRLPSLQLCLYSKFVRWLRKCNTNFLGARNPLSLLALKSHLETKLKFSLSAILVFQDFQWSCWRCVERGGLHFCVFLTSRRHLILSDRKSVV